jgi:hypothetical protein
MQCLQLTLKTVTATENCGLNSTCILGYKKTISQTAKWPIVRLFGTHHHKNESRHLHLPKW